MVISTNNFATWWLPSYLYVDNMDGGRLYPVQRMFIFSHI